MSNYILEGHEPQKTDDMSVWGKFMESGERRVGLTEIGDIRISTVFLRIDHSFGFGEPVLFETMIFGGKNDEYQERYTTWNEAEKGHEVAVKLVTDEIKNTK
jgi:hypothetical protein